MKALIIFGGVHALYALLVPDELAMDGKAILAVNNLCRTFGQTVVRMDADVCRNAEDMAVAIVKLNGPGETSEGGP
jgi:hypothetical protein